MLHDPDRYADPMEFIPERYLKTSAKGAEPDPHEIVFGYGRRYASLVLNSLLIPNFLTDHVPVWFGSEA